ncbi:MAG: hypothetical protein RL365_1395 [Bacteroidota bacterium]|jgi:uncharacterized protein YdhG (YjbR/CyaY superfamily)
MTEIETYIHTIKEKHGETAYKQLCILYQHLQQTLPKATECISYGMPCFKKDNKTVVYFASYKGHIGFYPTAKPIVHFKELLMSYKTSKGAIQFNLSEPLPISLINQIIDFNLNHSK